MPEQLQLTTILTGLFDSSLARQLGVLRLQGKLLIPCEDEVELALDVTTALGRRFRLQSRIRHLITSYIVKMFLFVINYCAPVGVIVCL